MVDKRHAYLIIACTFLLFLLMGFEGRQGFSPGAIRVPESLKQALLKNGVSKETVQRYLTLSAVSVDPKVILKNVSHREREEDYRAFLSKKRIDNVRQFLYYHKPLFKEIEKFYGVPKEVIVAILQVESSLGEHQEKHLVLEVYTSLASLIDPQIRKKIIQEASKAGLDTHSLRFKRQIRKKAAWGLRELTCLLRLSGQGKVDTIDLRGSWAGAFGMPQFIPTSFERYGVDWDKDGKTRLDRLPDAAASAANYLKAHGWKGRMSRKEALTVIRKYNHSQPYAETILKISKRLTKM